MSWAYNQIDVYFLTQDLPLGVSRINLDDNTDPTNNPLWIPASRYGILRGRPTLTPSQLNSGNTVSIPGRDGVIYPSMSTRGNAKLQFDVLIENSWVHNTEDDGSVAKRMDIMMALIRDAKCISYKMPGVPATFYLIPTKKAEGTITNADENCGIVQAQIEVFPRKMWFAGNYTNQISSGNPLISESHYPDGIAKPTFRFSGNNQVTGAIYLAYVDDYNNSVTEQVYFEDVYPGTVLDTSKCLAYNIHGSGQRDNVNSSFVGDYTKLWIPKNRQYTIATSINDILEVYTKEGVDL